MFVISMGKEPFTKFCGIVISFHEVIKIQKFEFNGMDVIPVNVRNISPIFMEKEPSTRFYGVLDHFSQTYEVIKF